jgi:hypothetical protein
MPTKVTGRVENFTNHKKDSKRSVLHDSPQPTKRLRFDSDATDTSKLERVLTSRETKTLHRTLLDLVHKSRLPHSFVDEPTTLAFCNFLCPGISKFIPKRNAFGGENLTDYADELDQADKHSLRKKMVKYDGARVNLLSDVWENIAKRHRMGNLLSLFGEMTTFEVSTIPWRHDAIATAIDLEAVMLKIVAMK